MTGLNADSIPSEKVTMDQATKEFVGYLALIVGAGVVAMLATIGLRTVFP